MKPTDYLLTAMELAGSGSKRPRQANLRRACSSTYYALFHTLCDECAGALTSKATRRAWTHAYRAVDHGAAKNSCLNNDVMSAFPDEVQDLADMFVQMQAKRHLADYDPNEKFYKSAVLSDIDGVRAAISGFKGVSKRDRKAFAVHILLKMPRK